MVHMHVLRQKKKKHTFRGEILLSTTTNSLLLNVAGYARGRETHVFNEDCEAKKFFHLILSTIKPRSEPKKMFLY
jgi:hypothetical protein